MKNFFGRTINTGNDKKLFVIRLIVGLIFLSEGIQKFLYPELVGTGRFTKIGFENAEFWAYWVGSFEALCGALIIVGVAVRLATIPLFTIMAVAIVTTKIPILTDNGFWYMAHAVRTDFALTMLLVLLFTHGAGIWSVDSVILKKITRNFSDTEIS